MKITDSMLDELREKVSSTMSPKRFRHTAEVEKMAEYLGSLYAPEEIPRLRAAALLHDVTKEYPPEQQIAMCKERGIALEADVLLAPKTLHARTAAAIIPEQFEDFADDVIISAVRWHTTGRSDMSVCERIIYLADYIDMLRTFEDCVRLREYFMSAHPEQLSEEERAKHLTKTLIMSFDMTMKGLIDDGRSISRDTVEARNSLIRELTE